MGLLNRSKKPAKLICPTCGKPNAPAASDDGPRRCRICRSILPQTVSQPEGGIDFGGSDVPRPSSGPSKSGIEHEPFDMGALKMTAFDQAPQGVAAARELAPEPLAPTIAPTQVGAGAYGGPPPPPPGGDVAPFDPNALVLGDPADPRPTE